MGRQARASSPVARRLGSGAGLAVLACVLAVAAPQPAAADGHEEITLTGADLVEPVTVRAATDPERYSALRTEVAWLVGRDGDAAEPDPDTRGPGYTMTWQSAQRAHLFELYPLAEGGPRVFRPAAQPEDRTVDEAWYFARLSLPETLRAVGVEPAGDQVGGGAGAGPVTPGGTEPPAGGTLGFLDEWREGMLLTAGLAAAVLAGLASIAFLLRRER